MGEQVRLSMFLFWKCTVVFECAHDFFDVIFELLADVSQQSFIHQLGCQSKPLVVRGEWFNLRVDGLDE
jgi:hypothetical protein